MADYNPNIICLQETMQKEFDNLFLERYKSYKMSWSAIDNRSTGGTSIWIKGMTKHEIVHLQAIDNKTSLHYTVIICTLYIPPR